MAKYKVDKVDSGVKVEVTGVQGDQQVDLMEAFKACQEGTCSCPTQEYRKLESLDVSADADGISLDLHAKAGTDIDPDEIKKCLDYTVAKLADGEPDSDS